MRLQHLDRWSKVAARAFADGATAKSSNVLDWKIAGNCEQPVYREYMGAEAMPQWAPGADFSFRAAKLRGELNPRSTGPRRRLEIWVRCRKCSSCMKARSRHWRYRAEAELHQARGRSWFGTLTLSTHEHAQAMFRARLRLARRGTVFEALAPDAQFAERHRQIGRELTLWLKRVRKNAGTPFRYMLVAERHKSGLPHYHVLVHETERPIRHAVLTKAWHLGFSQFKLVDEGDEAQTARYVAKYLTKAAAARVRASADYGETNTTSVILTTNQLESVTRHDDDLQRREPTEEVTDHETTLCRRAAPKRQEGAGAADCPAAPRVGGRPGDLIAPDDTGDGSAPSRRPGAGAPDATDPHAYAYPGRPSVSARVQLAAQARRRARKDAFEAAASPRLRMAPCPDGGG